MGKLRQAQIRGDQGAMDVLLEDHTNGSLDLRLQWHGGIYGQPQVIVIPLRDMREGWLYLREMASVCNLWQQGKFRDHAIRTTDEAKAKPKAKTSRARSSDTRKRPAARS